MTEGIPHTLATGYADLIAALDKGIRQYKANRRYSNAHVVCHCIERFVDALGELPCGQEELRRRATLVEILCSEGGNYATARAAALPSHRGQPRTPTASKSAIRRLRKSKGVPLYVQEVAEERNEIKRVLNERLLNLSPAARMAYESWKQACRAVEREAGPLEADGCWYLFHIHMYETGQASESGRAGLATAMVRSNAGGAHLKSIKAATESLMAWAKTCPRVDSETLPKKRGRKKADYTTVQSEGKLAGEWKRARDNGVYKADFATGNGMNLKDFDRLLDRVAARKKAPE